MFYQDHHLRDLFIFGSVALLAFAAMPARRAHAGEIYLCADGRNLEVDNASREQILRTDPCALAWAAMPKRQERGPQKASPQVVAAAQPQAARVETASVMLVNAEELPAPHTAGASAVKPAKTTAAPSVAHVRTRKVTGQRVQRSHRLAGVERGLAYMGDGIFAR